jgi:hypothetical protein
MCRNQLIPGGVRREYPSSEDKLLRIFYVGGIGAFYNLEMLFRVVRQLDFLTLTVCCRVADWEPVSRTSGMT